MDAIIKGNAFQVDIKEQVDAVITGPPDDMADYGAFAEKLCSYLIKLDPKNVVLQVPKGCNDIDLILGERLPFKYEYSICLDYTDSAIEGFVGVAGWSRILWYSNGGICHERLGDKISGPRVDPGAMHQSEISMTHALALCRMFSGPDELVIDPFCGTGNICLAAKMLGRSYIGIDIDSEYVKIAKRRINAQ